ncbi:3-phosphoserine/phosphohydroxythreonine transaminase [Endozoicomonas sp. GU-1]|uniref:3-phosphoserine/phosphohydroxythreonine transaminase n=1 Tax=Endozoicomonas sp. GU-1 TaxID=3009078 RepID=UPI0022B4A6E6|nr:3-phosphoserine/phosphohydroxythreonine transaminase [Endozoicomonas sp. GU-1]WBA83654.1 3-phosphoserine/phosphohydroxythreonine transaminase [Endozoicomonas sp. GU-1]WBA86632.1 3-phosphoserine/phosphohydroxythreonine transaminase [Endozoicomonas sp. GU-1]
MKPCVTDGVNDVLAQLDNRVYNFSAGPAPIPYEVLQQARDEMMNWQDVGASVMEVSHRGKEFLAVAHGAEKDLRDLFMIPDNYKVLFLQGGARGQFAAVPLNLKGDKVFADYVNSGYWAQSAIKEAQRYLDVNIVADGKDRGFNAMPAEDQWRISKDAAYLHYTPNETIGGLEFSFIPETGDVPLVADMSSNILSGPLDVSKFGVIYAGAQKNIGPAGLTVVIVREDLLERGSLMCPAVLDYKLQAGNDSMYNTPPTFAWYLAGLVFKWLKKQGGLAAINALNERKASKLYAQIDGSGFYQNPVDPKWRSRMNVPFTLINPELDATFLAESEQAGFRYLKGHKAVGGMRASIYNAVPEQHVDALIDFMKEFERRYG